MRSHTSRVVLFLREYPVNKIMCILHDKTPSPHSHFTHYFVSARKVHSHSQFPPLLHNISSYAAAVIFTVPFMKLAWGSQTYALFGAKTPLTYRFNVTVITLVHSAHMGVARNPPAPRILKLCGTSELLMYLNL
jgi:hypothetical protein